MARKPASKPKTVRKAAKAPAKTKPKAVAKVKTAAKAPAKRAAKGPKFGSPEWRKKYAKPKSGTKAKA